MSDLGSYTHCVASEKNPYSCHQALLVVFDENAIARHCLSTIEMPLTTRTGAHIIRDTWNVPESLAAFWAPVFVWNGEFEPIGFEINRIGRLAFGNSASARTHIFSEIFSSEFVSLPLFFVMHSVLPVVRHTAGEHEIELGRRSEQHNDARQNGHQHLIQPKVADLQQNVVDQRRIGGAFARRSLVTAFCGVVRLLHVAAVDCTATVNCVSGWYRRRNLKCAVHRPMFEGLSVNLEIDAIGMIVLMEFPIFRCYSAINNVELVRRTRLDECRTRRQLASSTPRAHKNR